LAETAGTTAAAAVAEMGMAAAAAAAAAMVVPFQAVSLAPRDLLRVQSEVGGCEKPL